DEPCVAHRHLVHAHGEQRIDEPVAARTQDALELTVAEVQAALVLADLHPTDHERHLLHETAFSTAERGRQPKTVSEAARADATRRAWSAGADGGFAVADHRGDETGKASPRAVTVPASPPSGG